MNGLAGTIAPPQYTCAGAWCSWDKFTTLGVCSNSANITDTTTVNCTGTIGEGLKCQYIFPDTGYTANVTFAQQTSSVSPASYIFKSVAISTEAVNTVMYTIRTEDPTAIESMDSSRTSPPSVQIFYGEWFWCAQTYSNLTATLAAPTNMTYTSERLQLNGESGPDATDYIYYVSYIAPSTGDVYRISGAADNELFASLANDLLSQGIFDMYPHAGYSQDEQDPLGIASFLYMTDIESMTTNLATMLTYQIWSDAQGDNLNATTIPGTTYVTKTYIRVTWPWLILPLAEALLTSFLMVITICLTWGQPLLKTSLIALLAHRLEGWSEDELAAFGKPNDDGALEKLVDGMKARLRENDQGLMRFSRDKSVP